MIGTTRKVFYVNSKKRLGGTTSSFTYEMKMPADSKFDSVCVLSASIPKSFYMIQEGSNTFLLGEDGEFGAFTTCTIPPGNYEASTFIVVLQTLLNTSSPHEWTYTIAQPDIQIEADTGKLTYSVVGNEGVQPIIAFNNGSYLYEQMGFAASSTNTFEDDTLTSTYAINLNRESTLYLHSSLVQSDDSDVLIEIFAAGSPDFANITYQCTAPELYSKTMRQTGSSYDFRLCNEDGKEIQLNGGDIQLTVCCYRRTRTLENIDKYMTAQILDHFEKNRTQNMLDLEAATSREPDQIVEETEPDLSK